MEIIKSLLGIESYDRRKIPEVLKEPSDPMAVTLFEGVQAYDPGVSQSAFTACIEFALAHPGKEPRYWTKSATSLTCPVTIAGYALYLHTGKNGRPFDSGTYKRAFVALELHLVKLTVDKRCELTVENTAKYPKAMTDAFREDKLAHTFNSPFLMSGSEATTLHSKETGGIELSLIQEFMKSNARTFYRDTTRSRQEREEVVAGIGQALIYLHKNGYVHRDLKPANVLIDEGPEGLVVRLSDFGLTVKKREIEAGTICGTFSSLPESLTSQDGKEITQGPLTDVYAFGVTAERILGSTADGPTKDWYGRLMSADHTKRPTAQEAMRLFEPLRVSQFKLK